MTFMQIFQNLFLGENIKIINMSSAENFTQNAIKALRK